MHRQVKLAAFFEQRDQLVKLRPGVRADEHDAHWMKEVFALGPGLGFHFIHDFLEALRSDRKLVSDFPGECLKDSAGLLTCQKFSILRIREGCGWVEMKENQGAQRKLLQFVDIRRKQINRPAKPLRDFRAWALRQQSSLNEEWPGNLMYPFRWALLDVMAVEPMELLHIKDRRRRRNPLQREFFY